MHWTTQACAIWSNACTLHAATVSSSPGDILLCSFLGTSLLGLQPFLEHRIDSALIQPDTHLVDGNRVGVLASGVGEKPYLGPASTGRREGLGLPRV